MGDSDWPGEPDAVLSLDRDGIDRLLDRLERTVPQRAGFVPLPARGASEAIVFGDTHGDWRSTREVVRLFEADGARRLLVGLGDYVDRTPRDCPFGSVANAIYLASLCAQAPDRVFLIQGNHETARRIPVRPHGTPEEIEALWGADPRRAARILGLLERGPVAAATENGAYFAHAGFPRSPLPTPWNRALEPVDEARLLEVAWAECAASGIRRGAAEAWGPEALEEFVRSSGFALVLRGHDPDITGRSLYGGRVLTLHTTRIFREYGGVIVARVPLDRPLRTTADLRVEHLGTERDAGA